MAKELFYDPFVASILLTYCDVIIIITLAIAPVYYYILLTQSKTLGKYKWFLLNQSVWSLLFTIVAVIGKPIFLFHAPAFYLGGVLRETSVEVSIIFFFLILSLSVMNIGGNSMSCAHRYTDILPGNIKTAFESPFMLVFFYYIHFIFIFLIIFFGTKAVNIPQETMRQYALNFSLELKPFVNEKTFFFVPEEIHNTPDLCIMTFLVILVLFFWAIMLFLKRQVDELLSSDIKKTLIMTVIAQSIVTELFVFIPFFFFFASLRFKIPNSGIVAEIAEMIVVSYSSVEFCIILCFVKPYRKFIIKNFNYIRGVFDPAFRQRVSSVELQRRTTIHVTHKQPVTKALTT